MASENTSGSGVPIIGTNSLEPTTSPAVPTFPITESRTPRGQPLKRNRTSPPQSFSLSPIVHSGLAASPSPKSPRFKGSFTPAYTPMPLTGAAAMDDQRRRDIQILRAQVAMSENPAHKALESLVGSRSPMSRPQDAPVATMTLSEGMSSAANAIVTSPMEFDDKSETSPTSITSGVSLGVTAPTATAGSTMVASPASMNTAIQAENRESKIGNSGFLQPPVDEPPSNRALSYPSNPSGRPDVSRIPSRGVSLPMPGQSQNIAPRSPSQKKHKCPYCETDFTRHHNLKSHLLTHSQEKPYVCQTCSMRFRRLHDLKRHTKLHTGERPHICPKCDRKFARGDALARHSKGFGGCAGRRPSMGGFEGDEDYDGSNGGEGDEAMDGVMYTNGTPNPNIEEMTEEDRRRFSLPSIKAQHVGSNHGSGDSYTQPHSRTPSTYPPAGPRPDHNTGGLYPPGSDRMASAHSASTTMQSSVGGRTTNSSISSLPLNTTGSSMFSSQAGMIESPKPLSPGTMMHHQLGNDQTLLSRQRSPSLTTQFQQQQFGRRPSGRSPPPGGNPSPRNSHTSKLPGLSSLAPPDHRFTLSSQTPTSNNMNGSHSQPPQQPSTLSSTSSMYPAQSSSSSREAPSANSAHHQNGSDLNSNLFELVEQLKSQVHQSAEKILALENERRGSREQITQLVQEVFSLRSQLANQKQLPPRHQPS